MDSFNAQLRNGVAQWRALHQSGGPGRHRELAAALQHRPAPRLSGLQATCSRGPRARPRRLVGCATPTRSAGQAPSGATISLELTSTPDHSVGAGQGGVAQPACVLNETTAGQARTSMQAKSEALPPRSRNLVLQGCAYERSDRFSRLTRPDIAQRMVNARSFGAAPRFDDPYGKVRECTPLWALPCSLLRLRGQGSAPLLVELLDISVPLCLPTTLGGLPTEQAQRLLVLDVWRRLAV